MNGASCISCRHLTLCLIILAPGRQDNPVGAPLRVYFYFIHFCLFFFFFFFWGGGGGGGLPYLDLYLLGYVKSAERLKLTDVICSILDGGVLFGGDGIVKELLVKNRAGVHSCTRLHVCSSRQP